MLGPKGPDGGPVSKSAIPSLAIVFSLVLLLCTASLGRAPEQATAGAFDRAPAPGICGPELS